MEEKKGEERKIRERVKTEGKPYQVAIKLKVEACYIYILLIQQSPSPKATDNKA